MNPRPHACGRGGREFRKLLLSVLTPVEGVWELEHQNKT